MKCCASNKKKEYENMIKSEKKKKKKKRKIYDVSLHWIAHSLGVVDTEKTYHNDTVVRICDRLVLVDFSRSSCFADGLCT